MKRGGGVKGWGSDQSLCWLRVFAAMAGRVSVERPEPGVRARAARTYDVEVARHHRDAWAAIGGLCVASCGVGARRSALYRPVIGE